MSTRLGAKGEDLSGQMYRSYLLRLWRIDQSGMCDWRASLEDTRTGQRIGFASLEDLFVFLMEQVNTARTST